MTLGEPSLLRAVTAEAEAHMDATSLNAAKTAASLMGMTNVYYRSLHMMKDTDYAKMPAGLRMNSMKTHGADHVDFDLWALAASFIGQCSGCINAHDKAVKDGGLPRQAVHSVLRIASVLNAAALVLKTEAAQTATTTGAAA